MAIGIEGHEAGVVRLRLDLLAREFDDREGEVNWGAEVVAPFVVPDAQDGGIGREEDRSGARGFGGADDPLLEGAVTHAVELDGVGDIRVDGEACRADGGDGMVREGGDRHGDVVRGGGAGGGEFAGVVRHGLEAGGGDP